MLLYKLISTGWNLCPVKLCMICPDKGGSSHSSSVAQPWIGSLHPFSRSWRNATHAKCANRRRKEELPSNVECCLACWLLCMHIHIQEGKIFQPFTLTHLQREWVNSVCEQWRFGEESNCRLCFIFVFDAQVSKFHLQVRQESMSVVLLFRGRRRP